MNTWPAAVSKAAIFGFKNSYYMICGIPAISTCHSISGGVARDPFLLMGGARRLDAAGSAVMGEDAAMPVLIADGSFHAGYMWPVAETHENMEASVVIPAL